ncbi:MAG: LysR family transcriptional regulator [Oscillospiraceae bacterium]|jgi:LysR family nitrogen assimilation transcriptional regulator|nr:LysR family transcriptional regulator [Oscillospiraceae bacterium]
MNRISMKQIEIFLTAARSKSISAVARSLYLSQPAVSAAILNMEHELGYKLLERTNRGVALTAAGKRLYARLEPVFRRFGIESQIIFDAGTDDRPKSVDLYTGAFHDSAAIRYMTAARSLFIEHEPGKTVGVECFPHDVLCTKLLCEELDFIFTFSCEIAGRPEYNCVRLLPLDIFFIVPAEWCGELDGSSAFLLGKTLLLEPSAGKETMLQVCHAHGLFPPRIRHVSSPLLIAQMIADGEGFSVGGPHIPNADALEANIRCIPVRVKDCNRYVHLVAAWRYDDDRDDTARYIKFLSDGAALNAALEQVPP